MDVRGRHDGFGRDWPGASVRDQRAAKREGLGHDCAGQDGFAFHQHPHDAAADRQLRAGFAEGNDGVGLPARRSDGDQLQRHGSAQSAPLVRRHLWPEEPERLREGHREVHVHAAVVPTQ